MAMATTNAIFVKGLAKGLSERHLQQLFVPYGALTGIQIARHRSGRSAGFAIISYATHDEARRAQQLMDQQTVAGRRINVRWYTPEQQQQLQISGMLSPRADDHSLTHALAALELMGGMSKTDHTLLRSLGISPGTQPLQSQLGLPGMGIWSPGLQAHTVPPPHCPPSDVGASFSSLGAAAHALAAAAVAVSSPRLAPTPTPNHAFSSAMASWLDNTAAAAMSQAYPGSQGMDHLRHSIDNTNPGKYGVRRRSTAHSARLSLDGLDLSALTIAQACVDSALAEDDDVCVGSPGPHSMPKRGAWHAAASSRSAAPDHAPVTCSSPSDDSDALCTTNSSGSGCGVPPSSDPFNVRAASQHTSSSSGPFDDTDVATGKQWECDVGGGEAAGHPSGLSGKEGSLGGVACAAPHSLRLPSSLDCLSQFERPAGAPGSGRPTAPRLAGPCFAPSSMSRAASIGSSGASMLSASGMLSAPNVMLSGGSNMCAAGMLLGTSSSFLSPRGHTNSMDSGSTALPSDLAAAFNGFALGASTGSSSQHSSASLGALGVNQLMGQPAESGFEAMQAAIQCDALINHLNAVRSQALLQYHASLQQGKAEPMTAPVADFVSFYRSG